MDCVIDTSVIVDYIILESELHKKAEEGLGKIENGFIPIVVVEELVSVLTRLGIEKKIINQKLTEVLDSYELLSIDISHILEAQEILANEEGTSFKRFNDKLLLSTAKAKGAALFTFDKELINECKANGVNLFPG